MSCAGRKAMVFAAGLGTRLKPFTLEHPKALVPVAGVPMLERVLLRLKEAGVEEAVVNVHHFAPQIVDFIERRQGFGMEIHISDESGLLLDTGGGILKARQWLDGGEPFFVHNADILTDIPLEAMMRAHCQTDTLGTLLVARRDTSRYLMMDSAMRMHGWQNTRTGQVRPEGADLSGCTPYAFGGVHVLSPRIFPLLEKYAEGCQADKVGQVDKVDKVDKVGQADNPFSIMDFYISICAQGGIHGWLQPEGTAWHDVGKPESLTRAEEWLKG